MLSAAADILIERRQNLYQDFLKGLSQEQWFTQPDGFANNIAWNVGHLVVAQQGLIYGRLGVDGYLTPELPPMFRPGTSPTDWTAQPDMDEIIKLFLEWPQKLAADIEAGKFDNYVQPEGGEGPPKVPQSALHAMIFNQFHEGLHRGHILDLMAFLK